MAKNKSKGKAEKPMKSKISKPASPETGAAPAAAKAFDVVGSSGTKVVPALFSGKRKRPHTETNWDEEEAMSSPSDHVLKKEKPKKRHSKRAKTDDKTTDKLEAENQEAEKTTSAFVFSLTDQGDVNLAVKACSANVGGFQHVSNDTRTTYELYVTFDQLSEEAKRVFFETHQLPPKPLLDEMMETWKEVHRRLTGAHPAMAPSPHTATEDVATVTSKSQIETVPMNSEESGSEEKISKKSSSEDSSSEESSAEDSEPSCDEADSEDSTKTLTSGSNSDTPMGNTEEVVPAINITTPSRSIPAQVASEKVTNTTSPPRGRVEAPEIKTPTKNIQAETEFVKRISTTPIPIPQPFWLTQPTKPSASQATKPSASQVTKPIASPATKPIASPATKPIASQAVKPTASQVTKPSASQATKPATTVHLESTGQVQDVPEAEDDSSNDEGMVIFKRPADFVSESESSESDMEEDSNTPKVKFQPIRDRGVLLSESDEEMVDFKPATVTPKKTVTFSDTVTYSDHKPVSVKKVSSLTPIKIRGKRYARDGPTVISKELIPESSDDEGVAGSLPEKDEKDAKKNEKVGKTDEKVGEKSGEKNATKDEKVAKKNEKVGKTDEKVGEKSGEKNATKDEKVVKNDEKVGETSGEKKATKTTKKNARKAAKREAKRNANKKN